MQLMEADRTNADEPPAFVKLVAHPVRWRLLRQLARSDRAVWELTRLVDEPQSLVSYHLRHLRDGGLVRSRRSSADGRDVYYALDLAACASELATAAGALHPALGARAATPGRPDVDPAAEGHRPRVLFVCTGNSARSQMAEALLVRLAGGTVDAASAGSHPKSLHPAAVRVLRRRGIDISTNRTTHLDEVATQRFDVVVTLCDRVREICPEFPHDPRLAHWSLPDPASEGGDDDAILAAFERTAVELESRISFLIHQLGTTPEGRSSHATR